MAVYKFKMQSILNIKEKLEAQAKQEFADANIRLVQEEALLEELKKRKDYYIEEGVKLRSSTIEPHLIHNNSLALEVLDDDIEVQKREVSVARKNVDAARQRMMDARAQTRIYEKLKEDDFAEFVSEQGKAEGKEIDELNSFRFSEKQRRGDV